MFDNLQCPFCSEREAINLNLFAESFVCNACEKEFTREEVMEIQEVWQGVFQWLDDKKDADRREKQ